MIFLNELIEKHSNNKKRHNLNGISMIYIGVRDPEKEGTVQNEKGLEYVSAHFILFYICCGRR